MLRNPNPPPLPPHRVIAIPTRKIAFAACQQAGRMWCWAASIEMVLRYYGVDVTQEDIVRYVYGTGGNGLPPDLPGSYDAMTRILNLNLEDRQLRRFHVRARRDHGMPPSNELAKELRAQKPVLLAYNPTSTSVGHAVVCTGMFHYAIPPQQVFQLLVRDPAHAGRRVIHGAASLVDSVRAHWRVRVTRVW